MTGVNKKDLAYFLQGLSERGFQDPQVVVREDGTGHFEDGGQRIETLDFDSVDDLNQITHNARIARNVMTDSPLWRIARVFVQRKEW